MSCYRYLRISEEMVEELVQATLRGESTVLLGPRFSGKHDLLRRISLRLKELCQPAVGPLRLLNPEPLTCPQALRRLLSDAVTEWREGEGLAGPPVEPEASSPLLADVDLVYKMWGRPLVLLLGNIDSLSFTLAQQLLEEIRVRTQGGRLTVVLSGESELRALTDGPLSPFDCQRKIFVQGFDLPLFRKIVRRYAATLGCVFEDPEAAEAKLWEFTGGNTALMRLVIWRLIEQRSSPVNDDELVSPPQISTRDLRLDPADEGRLHLLFRGDATFQGFLQIRNEPGCWPQLEKLLQDKQVEIEGVGGPTALEFAGVARREEGRLVLAGGLLGEYARKHYTSGRIADMYAGAGMWDGAFAIYSGLPPADLKRPRSTEERERFEPVLASFERELNRCTSDGTEALRNLMTRACSLLLGYERVSTLSLASPGTEPLVSTFPGTSGPAHDAQTVLREQQSWLAERDEVEARFLEGTGIRVLIRLPGLRSLQPTVLLVEDPGSSDAHNAARRGVLQRLIQQFAPIYGETLDGERLEERLRIREVLADSINQILGSLGGPGGGIQAVLKAADHALEQLGYDRTFIVLLDPTETKLQVAYARGFQQEEWLRTRIAYPLEQIRKEPLVRSIMEGRPILIHDARRYPGCDEEVVKLYDVRAKGIIPLLNPHGKALGAFHLERKDRGPITTEEQDEILDFGLQFILALEQDHRAHMLKRTLDMTEEPFLILSPSAKVRYCNEAGAKAVGLQESAWWWLDQAPALPKPEEQPGNAQLEAITGVFQDALRSPYRQVSHLRHPEETVARHDVVQSQRIGSGLSDTAGAMVHVDQLQYVGMYIAALERIAQAHTIKEVMRALLDVARIFNHPFARLWVLDPAKDDTIHLTLLYAEQGKEPRPPVAGEPAKIEGGETEGRRRERLAFRDSREPKVFVCQEPSKGDEEGTEVTLETGLRAEVVHPHPPGTPWPKKAGDIWMDFPLWARGQCNAKLTLGCTEKTGPEHLEMLAALSRFLANLLTTISENQELQSNTEEAAEWATATVAHNLARLLGSFPWILRKYTRLEATLPELGDTNRRFTDILKSVRSAIRRAKRLLRMVRANPSPVRLHHFLATSLNATFPEPADWQLDCDEEREVLLDEGLFTTALQELLDNCRFFTEGGLRPRVHVSVPETPAEANTFEIHVRDYGPGILPEYKCRIFEDFFSFRPEEVVDFPDASNKSALPQAAPKEGGGTGLGLAHMRRVIKAHEGMIEEIGEYGKGAHFRMVLPDRPRPGEKQ